MNYMKKSQKGFTLTELLITIAIVGILASLVLPRYFQTEAAHVSEAVSQLSVLRIAEEDFQNQRGCYANSGSVSSGNCTPGPMVATFNDLGVDVITNGYFDYDIVSASGTGFCARATRNSTGTPSIDFANTRVCLDEANTYYGTHPNGPGAANNPIGTSCAGVC